MEKLSWTEGEVKSSSLQLEQLRRRFWEMIADKKKTYSHSDLLTK